MFWLIIFIFIILQQVSCCMTPPGIRTKIGQAVQQLSSGSPRVSNRILGKDRENIGGIGKGKDEDQIEKEN